MTVSSASITIGITVTFMFHSFFRSLTRSSYLYLSSFLSGLPCGQSDRQSPQFGSFFLSFFLLLSGRLAEIWWSVCILKSLKILCILFSRTDSGLCTYHLFVLSNLYFLHNYQWITLPTQLCLVLYAFCMNLLHSVIMWSFHLYHHII